tara:strand:- start:823 stop:1068 length:246 start_codon:yes stop_codon:yes gene_type:complete
MATGVAVGVGVAVETIGLYRFSAGVVGVGATVVGIALEVTVVAVDSVVGVASAVEQAIESIITINKADKNIRIGFNSPSIF